MYSFIDDIQIPFVLFLILLLFVIRRNSIHSLFHYPVWLTWRVLFAILWWHILLFIIRNCCYSIQNSVVGIRHWWKINYLLMTWYSLLFCSLLTYPYSSDDDNDDVTIMKIHSGGINSLLFWWWRDDETTIVGDDVVGMEKGKLENSIDDWCWYWCCVNSGIRWWQANYSVIVCVFH